MSPTPSPTWPCCTTTRAATPRPSRSKSAHSPSARRRWAPTTPMSPSPSRPGRAVPRPGPLRRGRAALQALTGHHEKALGPDHPDVAAALNNLAELYEAQGRTPRPSRSTSAHSPSTRRRWVPTTPMSPPTSTTWPSCTSQGRYGEAEPLYKRPSPSTRRRWAPTTPMSAPTLNNLAGLYFVQSDWGVRLTSGGAAPVSSSAA